jgi:Spy/CpxP family protein refolding chaperone
MSVIAIAAGMAAAAVIAAVAVAAATGALAGVPAHEQQQGGGTAVGPDPQTGKKITLDLNENLALKENS